jgi:hypothetical protein
LDNGSHLLPLDEFEEKLLDSVVPLIYNGGPVSQALNLLESFILETLVLVAFWLILEETPFNSILIILFKETIERGLHKGY